MPTSVPEDSLAIVFADISGSTSLYRTAAPVPVPAAVWLLGSALGALGVARRRGMKAKG